MEGDAINHADDVHDLAGTFLDRIHGRDDLGHDAATFHRDTRCRHHQLIGLQGTRGGLPYRRRQLLHGGSSLFQGAGLGLGTRGQFCIAGRNFVAGTDDGIRAAPHFRDDTGKIVIHLRECLE